MPVADPEPKAWTSLERLDARIRRVGIARETVDLSPDQCGDIRRHSQECFHRIARVFDPPHAGTYSKTLYKRQADGEWLLVGGFPPEEPS